MSDKDFDAHFQFVVASRRADRVSLFDPPGSILQELRQREWPVLIDTGPELLDQVRAENLFPLTPALERMLGTPGYTVRTVLSHEVETGVYQEFGTVRAKRREEDSNGD